MDRLQHQSKGVGEAGLGMFSARNKSTRSKNPIPFSNINKPACAAHSDKVIHRGLLRKSSLPSIFTPKKNATTATRNKAESKSLFSNLVYKASSQKGLKD
jgi:hypothetical protein